MGVYFDKKEVSQWFLKQLRGPSEHFSNIIIIIIQNNLLFLVVDRQNHIWFCWSTTRNNLLFWIIIISVSGIRKSPDGPLKGYLVQQVVT